VVATRAARRYDLDHHECPAQLVYHMQISDGGLAVLLGTLECRVCDPGYIGNDCQTRKLLTLERRRREIPNP
jgi:hypothetical protein